MGGGVAKRANCSFYSNFTRFLCNRVKYVQTRLCLSVQTAEPLTKTINSFFHTNFHRVNYFANSTLIRLEWFKSISQVFVVYENEFLRENRVVENYRFLLY